MHDRSRAFFYALLLLLLLALPGCGGAAQEQGNAAAPPEQTQPATQASEKTAAETTAAKPETTAAKPETKRAVPEAPPEGMPELRDFFEEGKGSEPVQIKGAAGSAGAIPAVKPFNFGRDPGGPEDKTLYITVPKLGLESVPAFDEVSEDALKKGSAHIPATGYPWQEGANVYVAGHRLGYPGTESDHVFYDLDLLVPGDEIFVTDSAGGEYKYTVTEQVVVPPDNVEVMNPVPDRSVLSLQTCTLPDYVDRIVVQAELV